METALPESLKPDTGVGSSSRFRAGPAEDGLVTVMVMSAPPQYETATGEAGLSVALSSGGRLMKSMVARAVSPPSAVFSQVELVAATSPRQLQRASTSL